MPRNLPYDFLGTRRRSQPRSPRAGFTLVEIMIVIVILGILATIVIPRFTDATHVARENTLKDALRYLRSQAQVYSAQHHDTAPGYPGGDTNAAPTEQDFLDQMTQYTTEQCAVSATTSSTYRFGPYLSKMPANPLTGSAKVTITTVTPFPTPTTDDGWFYNPRTQDFAANCFGSDTSGMAYSKY